MSAILPTTIPQRRTNGQVHPSHFIPQSTTTSTRAATRPPLYRTAPARSGCSRKPSSASTRTPSRRRPCAQSPPRSTRPRARRYPSAPLLSRPTGSRCSCCFEISQATEPELIFDYYSCRPRPTTWCTRPIKKRPGVRAVRGGVPFAAQADRAIERGLGYGAFVPMALIRPAADIPIVTVSINDRLGAPVHFALGAWGQHQVLHWKPRSPFSYQCVNNHSIEVINHSKY